MSRRVARISLFALLALASLSQFEVHAESAPSPHPVILGVDETAIDRSVDPCQDFYQFACGTWLAKTPIPADLPIWSRGFADIAERNKLVLKELLEGYASGKTSSKTPYAKKLGDFYQSCMDESAIEKDALPTLKENMKEIDSFSDLKALAPLVAKLHSRGVGAFFGFGSEQDAKEATLVIGVADQGGLRLPDRDYYLKDDVKMAGIRQMYVEHIEKMEKLYGRGEAEAKADAQVILKIETALAKASMARVDRRDPKKVYHRLERQGLKEKTPVFDWDQYFATLGYPSVQAINVAVPDFFSGLNETLKGTSLADLKTYMRWAYLVAMSSALPKAFVEERFRFTSTAFTGQKELPARWKRCVRAADDMMGFALGQGFVEKSYGEEGKAMTKDMIQKIEQVFGSRLKGLKWMDKPTREQAERKLGKIFNKVGYPDKWRNYDSMQIERKSYLKNIQAGAQFGEKYELDKIGKPLDRTEWDMSPPVVNAYYSANMNEMVFPAGILQPPFFERRAGIAANYGGIGMVMGHELTHGFDDEGRQFDADGNLKEWWTPKVAKDFDQKAACIVKQYDGYKVQDLHVNGKLTLGENIADTGGIQLAYDAWKMAGGHAPATVPGTFSEEQQFFLSFAQTWCTKRQPQIERMLITTDPHSPPEYRVNGPLRNFGRFAKAFGCKTGTPMAPKNRCEIW